MILGIAAHVDAGKTTLAEAMLYLSGTIRKAGRVDHGDAFLDTDRTEKERGITIFSKIARLMWNERKLVLLDTPGHVDFSAEMERTLQVMDAAVLVISGTDGVQSHTRTLWRLLKHYGVPVFIFVNKMDLGGADREKVLEGLKEELDRSCVDFTASPAGTAEHGTWAENVATGNEALLDEYLGSGDVKDTDVAKAIADRQLFPVWFGSALRMEGVRELIDGICRFSREKAWPDRFAARVYKISRDGQGMRLTWLKLTGGSLRVRDSVRIGDSEEKADQLRLYSGEKYETAELVRAGDICAVAGLDGTRPGDCLGAERGESEPLLEPVETCELVLPPDADARDIYRRMLPYEEEYPELHIVWDEAHEAIRVQLMGDVQTDIFAHMIEDDLGIRVSFGPGRVIYKETVAQAVEGVGHFEPLRHYAEVHVLIEPGDPGSGVQVFTKCPTDVLAHHWQQLVMSHVLERDYPGVLTGSALTDVRITLLAGRASVKHTEGGDFREATGRAIRQGLMSTECVLLEPVYSFFMEVPEDAVGRALTDLAAMGAKTEPPAFRESAAGRTAVLKGDVPASETAGYAAVLRSYTRGEGTCTFIYKDYEPCHNAEEVIRSIGYDAERDTANPCSSVFCSHGAGFIVPWNKVREYMHVPAAWAGDEPEDSFYDDGTDVFGAENGFGRGIRVKKDVLPEEDEEYLAIYQREFGGRSETEVRERERGRSSSLKRRTEVRQKLDKHGQPIYPKKDEKKPYLIIDGYNMIYAWPELRALFEKNMDAARGKLVDILDNYRGYLGIRMTVVFDAWKMKGGRGSREERNGLEILYTEENETADSRIERMVHELTGKYHITVATSDGLEQLTVMRLGALRMSARELQEDIRRVTGTGEK
ncbi:MAG: NYN domain-containing protein [Chordicoccus sp.]